MKNSLKVRPVVKDDHPSWKILWDNYNAFYGRHGDTALPPEISDMTWSRFFDAYEPMHAAVAELDGRVVGIVHFLYHRSTTYINPTCYLQDLFTTEEARGKGVGAALIAYVTAQARSAGAARVYWQTHETNTQAMRLYDQVAEKSGFLVYRKVL